MITALEPSISGIDVRAMRNQFAILKQTMNGYPLAYLDNAATSQKPSAVITALNHYYQMDNANVHRGVHMLSVRATDAYENAREVMRQFLNAKHSEEIVFVKNGTEAINLVANGLAADWVKAGDEICLTQMEHHANIVPWQMLCDKVGARLNVIPITPAGEIDLDALQQQLNPKVRLLAIAHVSNVLGTVNPIREIINIAHQRGIPVLVDGAQAAPHIDIDVQDYDCDFYTVSGHKMYGPTGTGVLYAKSVWLEKLPPYQGGGDMIKEVTFEKTIYSDSPHKFEAGTPNIAGHIALAVAAQFIQSIGYEKIAHYEQHLLEYATRSLSEIPGVRIYGTTPHKAPVLSFTLDNIHPHDIGTVLDQYGIAVRTGHHCAMPLMSYYGVSAMARASFAVFNTEAEIDRLYQAVYETQKVFA